MPTLAELLPGQTAEILAVRGEPGLVQRLSELGLLEGERVEFLAAAPLGDPLEIRLGNSRLTLRKADAAGVSVSLV